MKLVQKPTLAPESAIVAPADVPVQPEPAEPALSAPAAQAAPPSQQPPQPAPQQAPVQTAVKPPRKAAIRARARRIITSVTVAQVPPASLTPPSSVTPASSVAGAATSAPTPEPVKETPAAQPIPPARPDPENATPPPAPEPHRVTLNAGTLIPVRLVDGLSSERNLPGDAFAATLDKELVADGFVIAERGARVEGRVVAADRGGKVRGISTLSVELTRVHTSDGQNVPVNTDSFEKQAEQSHREDAAERIGAGAAIGAVIGAIGGGGKGAAIGAGAGGGIGAGSVLLSRGDVARLPTETRISFRLRAPVTLTERQN